MLYINKKTKKFLFFNLFLIGAFFPVPVFAEQAESSHDFLFLMLIGAFMVGSLLYFRNIFLVKENLPRLKEFTYSLRDVRKIATAQGRPLPKIGIFVPARNEGFVIENTVRRLISLDYPKDRYKIFIIVDERELDDEVEELTKDVVKRTTAMDLGDFPSGFINCIQVPKWYSGRFGDYRKIYNHSTKGRALNFALEYLKHKPQEDDLEMIGVLDADGRLDKDVLKEVAYKRLMLGSRILQGPVFQVSNFKDVSIVGIAAGIELAVHHVVDLSQRLLAKKGELQFLAGTNYFFEKELILDVGGWNAESLVEDAELAIRSYVEKGIVAEWLSCPEIEQTPPSFKVYKRQRERWVRGHLQLVPYIMGSGLYLREKVAIFLKIYGNMFRVIIDLGLPVFGWTLTLIGTFVFLGPQAKFISICLLFVSLLMFDFYGYMYRRLSSYIKKDMSFLEKIRMSFVLFLFAPMFVVIQSIPRILAMFNYFVLRKTNGAWYKTERTKEVSGALPEPAWSLSIDFAARSRPKADEREPVLLNA